MKIKNFIVEDNFIDCVLKDLCTQGKSYVFIDYKDYKELHTNDIIFRFYSFNQKLSLTQTNNNIQKNKIIKERPGYKVLKKTDYKKFSKQNTFGY